MGRFAGSRSLVAIGAVLVLLLGALAAVQYRWSTRVAAADAQREREHLESAAALLASEFTNLVGEASVFVQNSARPALESGQPLPGVPRILGELYYLESPVRGEPRLRRLSGGTFSPVPVPEWIAVRRCSVSAIEQPPALVIPVYEIGIADGSRGTDRRIQRTYRWRQDRCFIARIDEPYLRETLFPQLIRRAFGATAAREYEFAVVAARRQAPPLYGFTSRPDLRKPFFSMLGLAMLPKPPLPRGVSPRRSVFIQLLGAGSDANLPPLPDPMDRGMWELHVERKGLPLAAFFERRRKFDLLLSLGVELLLVAAVVLLVVGARRTERLADQKMRFVAGVSHELRSPVSAISMLSRNQADGLVAGPDKVRQYGELIHQQSRRLSEMVEQSLEYAGIHSSLRRPAKEEVDLRRIIQEALDARREALERAGFQVEVDVSSELPPLAGDALLLRMAVDNLLSNALAHAGSGRWICVTAAHLAPEKEVRVSVEDRGAGIDPAEQAQIFEPFCRGRAAIEDQIPGSGLGLSLVRTAAEAHRGSVTLVSDPGKGSVFTVHLPV